MAIKNGYKELKQIWNSVDVVAIAVAILEQ